MSERLDIHPATPDEIVAAHTNVYDVWSQGRSPEAHLRYRLESPTHSRARWYVGTLDGLHRRLLDLVGRAAEVVECVRRVER